MRAVTTPYHEFKLEGETGEFRIDLDYVEAEEGIDLIRLTMAADRPAVPSVLKLCWSMPIVEVQALWYPGVDRNKALHVDWGSGYRTNATSSAPMGCFYSQNGFNQLTFAFSDALNPVVINAGVHEEDATFRCSVTLFDEQAPKCTFYKAELRIDRRQIRYYESIDQVRLWWEQMPEYEPMKVPEAARRPMYSTWYSFHQELTDTGVEEQCGLASQLGCSAVIVDDGWQTSNNERGYAYTGDWEVYGDKIGSMRNHVKRVKSMGMNYLLWYSVPFVGLRCKVWKRFKNKLLYRFDELGAGVLDPRYPEVREYLISIYEHAVRDWDIDGFKLDFVDSFTVPSGTVVEYGNGRDLDSVPEAVDRLLTDVRLRLSAIKSDMMIEFRQTYIGPLMRKYGNLFRAGDCPNDFLQNRVRTLDVRLLAGDTAVHSDMIMWHPSEPVESAAKQILNVLFSVPQVSVKLDQIPQEQLNMLRFWLDFWMEHRHTLLDGKLRPVSPELQYPVVTAESTNEKITVAFSSIILDSAVIGKLPDRLILINATGGDRLILDLPEAEKSDWQLTIKSCNGHTIARQNVQFTAAGLLSVPIPQSGLAILDCIN
jgi:alpha-galactosidase